MKLDFAQPKTAWTVGAGIVTALLVLPNLGKGWDALRYVTDAVPSAYAGKAVAEDVRSDFDRYLEAQQQATEQQAAVAEAIQGYISQQQANAPMGEATDAPLREWDERQGTYWCCPISDRERCWEEQLWQTCR